VGRGIPPPHFPTHLDAFGVWVEGFRPNSPNPNSPNAGLRPNSPNPNSPNPNILSLNLSLTLTRTLFLTPIPSPNPIPNPNIYRHSASWEVTGSKRLWRFVPPSRFFTSQRWQVWQPYTCLYARYQRKMLAILLLIFNPNLLGTTFWSHLESSGDSSLKWAWHCFRNCKISAHLSSIKFI